MSIYLVDLVNKLITNLFKLGEIKDSQLSENTSSPSFFITLAFSTGRNTTNEKKKV